MHAYLLVLLVVLGAAFAQKQTCYWAQGNLHGLTNCNVTEDKPTYTYLTIEQRDVTSCNLFVCFPNPQDNRETFHITTTDFDAIPLPRKYMQLTYYRDYQCLTNSTRMHFYVDSLCTNETSFYATCDDNYARVIYYDRGCENKTDEYAYPLNQCVGTPGLFIKASCGSVPSTSPVPPYNTSPQPSFDPAVIRNTPLTCYYDLDYNNNTILYDVTDGNSVCISYDMECPPNTNNDTNHCVEGTTITMRTFNTRRNCDQLFKQATEYYSNVVCCDTSYCNGDQPPSANVSLAVLLVPSLVSWLVAWYLTHGIARVLSK